MLNASTKAAYETPAIVTWTAAELDSVEASMSGGWGGGGGGGGGIVVPPISNQRNYTSVSCDSTEYTDYVSGYYYPNVDSGRVYFEGHRTCYLAMGMRVGWSGPIWSNGNFNYYFTIVAACEGAVIPQSNDSGVAFADVVDNLSLQVSSSTREARINENTIEFFASPPLPDDVSSNDIDELNNLGYALDAVTSLITLPASMPVGAAFAIGDYVLSNYGYTLGQLATRGWFISHQNDVMFSPPWRTYSRYPCVSAGLTFEVSSPVGCDFTLSMNAFSAGGGESFSMVNKTVEVSGNGKVNVL
ncbi:hypothetical protein [Denitrobacterium detoxificans]|uniref:hypothetical protein n=1 Tax=Denitrobacterium detoxificans TaxID=79604 RepID=UPI0026EE89C7|nr:hypothetical protein [Denitrobacterium detoxificans]MBE6465399.1 hypothetical protein [Denitrobacterium detoxificans]